MEPIFGFLIYGLAALVVGIIAGKRTSSLKGFLSFIAMCVASFVFVIIASRISNGNGLVVGFTAFIPVLLGLIVALSVRSDEDMAINSGESQSFKKCSFCAEAVRKEAIKCKHCGSDLTSINSSPESAPTILKK